MGKRKGRPSKAGKRTASGRLSRAGRLPAIVPPSPWVEQARAVYGEHYNSALGRAYVAGLLGEGQQAKDRLDQAKRFSRVYGRLISRDTYRCALDNTPRSSVDAIDPNLIERDANDQAWLFVAMKKIDETGCRPYFDQLISTLYTDKGPYWLDALIAGGSHPADRAVLNAAIMAIDAIVPKRKNLMMVA